MPHVSLILVLIGFAAAGISALVLTLPFVARFQWFKDLFIDETAHDRAIEIIEQEDDDD